MNRTQPTPKEPEKDRDIVNAEIALQRAAKLARERAARFGLGVMVWKDGKIVEEK